LKSTDNSNDTEVRQHEVTNDKMKPSISQLTKYSILFLIFACGLGIFVIPYFSNIKKIYKSLTSEAAALESKYNTGQGLSKAREDYQNYKDKLPTYQTLFIKEGKELSLVTKLEEIADKYHLKQDLSLSTEKLMLANNIKKVPFNFNLKGNFNDLLRYLSEISKINTNLTIQNVNVKQGLNDELEISLLGYTYWLKE